jgi:Flp pilus assembly protein TadG
MFWPLLRSIKDDCRGVSALEFAFVAPLLIMLLTGIAQVGMSYFVKNHMQDVAYDITRRIAVGALTPEQAENYARSRLSKLGIDFEINTQKGVPAEPSSENDKLSDANVSFGTTPTDGGGGSGSESDKNTVTTVISAKAADIAHFDIMGFYDGQLIEVSASMYTD